jgi:hypothetical protein
VTDFGGPLVTFCGEVGEVGRSYPRIIGFAQEGATRSINTQPTVMGYTDEGFLL